MEKALFEHKKASANPAVIVRKVIFYIFLIIASCMVLIPILWVFMQSLKSKSEFSAGGYALAFPKSFSLSNYAAAWTTSNIGGFFFNSVIVTVLGLILSIVLCVPAAYVLSRFKFRFSALLFALMTAGIFINVNYIVRPLYILINNIGFFFGIRSLTNNYVVVSIVYAVNSCSFGIFLLSGFLRTMPKGYEEAAKIDGCGYFGTLFKVVIPLCLPSIITVILFNFLNYWNEYLIAYVFMNEPSMYTIPIGLMLTRATDNRLAEFGRLYAGLIIAMLPTLILYCFVQGKLTKGMSVGGLKG